MCDKIGRVYNMYMKNITSIAVSLFVVAMFATSCNVEKSEKYQALLAERDSLQSVAIAASGGYDEALNTINEIENALEAVRAAEGIIIVENQEGNTNRAVSEINAIQQTLQDNRDKIDKLEKQLAEQGANSKALKQTIDRLKKQIDEKDTYINSLKNELQLSKEQIAELNTQVSDLNQNIDNLNSDIENQNVQIAAQQATINIQDATINTVWYCVATNKVLVEKGLITKGGLFSSSDLAGQGIDKTQLVQADKRSLTQIPLNTKKATLITKHPEGSYQLVEGESGALTLEITDTNAFWSISNYLIVSIK